MAPDDPSLKSMISEVTSERDLAQACIDRAAAETAPKALITDGGIDTFVEFLREKIAHGNIDFRRAYLRAVIRQIQIHPEGITVVGHGNQMQRQLAA